MPERDNNHSQQEPRQLTPEEEQERKCDLNRSKSLILIVVAWTILAVVAGFYVLFWGIAYMFGGGELPIGRDLHIISIVYVLGLIFAFLIRRPKRWGLLKRWSLLVNVTLYSVLAIVILGPTIFEIMDSLPVPLPQGVVEEKEIKKISFSELSSFGESVSISDEFAVIGAKGDNSNTGSVFIYQKGKNKDEDWALIKKLTAPGGEFDDNFGQSLSISRDIIAVGSPRSVYVFLKNKGGENNWGEIKKIIPSGSKSGIAVSLDGDILVVGIVGIMGTPGAAYVFKRHYGGTDNWGQIKKLIASDFEKGDDFGHSVSISGDTIIVSSPLDDDKGFNSGSAYIYQRNKGGLDNWGEIKKITSPDDNANRKFGYALSISGANIIISAIRKDFRGSAYIFDQNKGGFNNWGFVQKLIAYDRKHWYWFGTSVCITNDTAIVYSYGNDSAYVFKKNKDDTDNWQLQKKLIPSDYSPENKSLPESARTAVSISSETIVIGRSGGDIGINRGVYIYKKNTGY